MRLKHRQHALASDRFCRFQGRFDFSRMMSVIIDQQKTRAVVFNFKAPPRVLEFRQRLGDFFKRNAKLSRERDDAERVTNVVLTRNIQNGFAEFFFAAINRKRGREIAEVDISAAIISILRQPVANHAIIRSTYARGVWLVDTIKDFACRVPDQFNKNFLNRGQIGVKVEMLLLYIKYQGMLGMKQGDRAITFVAFSHEKFAARVPVRVGPE